MAARRLPYGFSLLAITASLLTAGRSLARDKARVALRYERLEGANESCPDEATMRKLVAAELGYDPFVERAERSISITLRSKSGELVGLIALAAADQRRGERMLHSSGKDCSELASSVALAVALAIDPEAVGTRSAPAAPPVPSAATPRPAIDPPRETPPTAAPPRARPLAIPIDLGLVLGGGVVPGTNVGFRAGVAIQDRSWSIAAEGTALARGTRQTPFGDVSAGAVFASVVPCLGLAPRDGARVDLCATANFGALFARASNVSRAFPTTDGAASLGPRAAFTWMPWQPVGFRASAELDAALTRVHLRIEEGGVAKDAWTAPELAFLGTIALIVRLR